MMQKRWRLKRVPFFSSSSFLSSKHFLHKVILDSSQIWDSRFDEGKWKDAELESSRVVASRKEGDWEELLFREAEVEEAAMIDQLGGLQCPIRSSPLPTFHKGWTDSLAMEFYEEGKSESLDFMVDGRVQASKSAYMRLLKECARAGEGARVHAHLVKSGLMSDMFLGNALAEMYTRCERVWEAQRVLDRMPRRNVFSWTIVISAYANRGRGAEALLMFDRMQQEGIVPDKVTLASVVKACTSLLDLERGRRFHFEIEKRGLESDRFIGSNLISMYAKCGCLESARRVFDMMCERDVVSWSVMIDGYARHGHGREALALFERMQSEGIKPNQVTFLSILKACGGLAALEKGKEVHASIKKNGFDNETFMRNSLIDMYAKCGSLVDARQVLSGMRERDVVSWSAMIAGCVQHGHGKEAFALFERMQEEGVKPDEVTFVSVLNACAQILDLERGRQVHDIVKKNGFDSDAFIGSALIDMYRKCGSIEDACRVFDGMRKRDVVSWSAMIAAYAQHGYGWEALALFERMQWEGVKPNKVVFVSILKACASLVALERGKQIHANIKTNGYDADVYVASTLVDMYAKCGSIEDARQVFDEMQVRDVVSWSAMIAGYAQHGHGKDALTLFNQMQLQGVRPNEVTFTCVLSACNHMGLIEEGYRIFDSMHQVYGMKPTVEHYGCMIDLLGRTGHLLEAKDFINKMPMKPHVNMWMILLGSCRIHGNAELGRWTFENVMKLEPENVAAYALLSNIYVDVGRWEEVAKLRKEMSMPEKTSADVVG